MQAALANVFLITGVTGVGTLVGLVVTSALERRQVYAPIQAICHMFDGEGIYNELGLNRRRLVLGVVLNIAAMVGWAILLEIGLHLLHVRAKSLALNGAAALAMTVLAYIVDFYLVPKRFTPGFENVLSRRGVFLVYGFLLVSFLAATLLRR